MIFFDYTSLFLIVLNVFVFFLFSFLMYVIYKHYKYSMQEEDAEVKKHAYEKASEMLTGGSGEFT